MISRKFGYVNSSKAIPTDALSDHAISIFHKKFNLMQFQSIAISVFFINIKVIMFSQIPRRFRSK